MKIRTAEPAYEAPLTGLALVGAVVLFCVLAAMSALIEALLVPFYVDGVIFPVTLVIVVVANIALPRMLRGLVGSTGLGALPVVAWTIVVLLIGFYPNPMGDIIIPGYGDGQYVGEALILLGILVGVLAVFTDTRFNERVAAARTARAGTGQPKTGQPKSDQLKADQLKAAQRRPRPGR